MKRVLLVDYEKNNLVRLSNLFRDKYKIDPSIFTGRLSSLYEFILHDEDGVIFIRIDNASVNGLEISRKAGIWYPRIQVVWMSDSESNALDAFAQGIDSYLVLPANWEKLQQIVQSLQYKKKRYDRRQYV
ncbi:MAG: hypothetical protein PHC92_07825 [Syntrophomonadaceae bacterium]|nr:hypothetical protein [Syntrophomonadaceae bacterium]MDD3024047.1 hypothetical protein [Syntrophomonadaceae bacterium]